MAYLTRILLQSADAVLVPGGFGDRGVEGKIIAAKYARENNIPYLGICLGMQTAVIEYARSILGLENANSTEFDPNTKSPCVIFMPEVVSKLSLFLLPFPVIVYVLLIILRQLLQGSKTHMGGTMRLGSRRTYFHVADSKASQL